MFLFNRPLYQYLTTYIWCSFTLNYVQCFYYNNYKICLSRVDKKSYWWCPLLHMHYINEIHKFRGFKSMWRPLFRRPYGDWYRILPIWNTYLSAQYVILIRVKCLWYLQLTLSLYVHIFIDLNFRLCVKRLAFWSFGVYTCIVYAFAIRNARLFLLYTIYSYLLVILNTVGVVPHTDAR